MMTQTQEARPIFGVSVLETLTVGLYSGIGPELI